VLHPWRSTFPTGSSKVCRRKKRFKKIRALCKPTGMDKAELRNGTYEIICGATGVSPVHPGTRATSLRKKSTNHRFPGRFRPTRGRYVPPYAASRRTRAQSYEKSQGAIPNFQKRLDLLLKTYAGRPTRRSCFAARTDEQN